MLEAIKTEPAVSPRGMRHTEWPAGGSAKVFATFSAEEALQQAVADLSDGEGWTPKYHTLAFGKLCSGPHLVLRSTLVSRIAGRDQVRTTLDPYCRMTRALWGIGTPPALTDALVQRLVDGEWVLVISVKADPEGWAEKLRARGATLAVSRDPALQPNPVGGGFAAVFPPSIPDQPVMAGV